uniref:Rho-GAP domain-containing protein n=1 Tax=Eptatretus burgeri TaxID=7764 RepID=A0A8C4RBE0_EPTBU
MIQDVQHSTRATLLLTCLFPPHSLPTLRCLLFFLNRVASRFQENKMNAENLALVFAPSLMKGKGRGVFPARSGLPGIERDHRLKVLIVLKLITHADCIGRFPKPNTEQRNPEANPSAGLMESSISGITLPNRKLSHNTRHRRESNANASKQIVRGSAVEDKRDVPDALDGGAQKRKSPVATLPPQGLQKKRRSSSDEGQSSASPSACETVHLPLRRSGKQMSRLKSNQVIGQCQTYQKDAFGPSGTQVTSSLFLKAPFSTSAVGELYRRPSDAARNVQQALADSRRACDAPKGASSPCEPNDSHSKVCAQTSVTSDNSNYCIVFDESLHITSDEDENSEDGGSNECCKKLDCRESKDHEEPSSSAPNASRNALRVGLCEERPDPPSLEQSFPREMPKEVGSAANQPSVKVSEEQNEGATSLVSPAVQRKPSRGGVRTYRNSPRRPVIPIRSMSIRAAWDL